MIGQIAHVYDQSRRICISFAYRLADWRRHTSGVSADRRPPSAVADMRIIIIYVDILFLSIGLVIHSIY